MRRPSWTDHNSSDPGITMLQLLAYVLVPAVAGIGLTVLATRRRGRGAVDPDD